MIIARLRKRNSKFYPLVPSARASNGALLHRCKSYGQVYAEPKARRRAPKVGALGEGVAARWGLEEAQSETAGR